MREQCTRLSFLLPAREHGNEAKCYHARVPTVTCRMEPPAWNLASILYAWPQGFQALTSSVWHRHNKQMLRSKHIVRPLPGWYSPTYPFQAPTQPCFRHLDQHQQASGYVGQNMHLLSEVKGLTTCHRPAGAWPAPRSPLPANSCGRGWTSAHFTGQTIPTIINRYTRWPEAIPMADATATSRGHSLMSHHIAQFGVPTDITSDRRPQFTSNLWTTLGKLLGAQLHHTTAYHPCTGKRHR